MEPRAPTLSQERMLLDLVQRLGRLRAGRTGVHIHLSSLSKAYSRKRFRCIALDSFATYVSGFEGNLFPLKNGDIFFLAKDVTPTLLDVAVNRIRLLFSQDPVHERHTIDGESLFCTYYPLESRYEELLTLAQDMVRQADIDLYGQEKEELYPPLVVPIEPEALVKLELALKTVDVTNLVRRQTVATIVSETAPQPLFEEIYISIDTVQKSILPNVSIISDRWLFQYLTHILDARLMHMLVRDGVRSERPFSINLNVQSVLSPTFAKFEQVITPQLRGRLVIELNKLDVFSDMGAFLFARDYLHDHGFRLCLDGLTHHTLPFYSRAKLGFDLVKIYWAPNGLDSMLPSMVPDIRHIVMETGQAHTILCRCEDARAIQIGQDLGIVMFQGYEVDRKLAATGKPY